MQKILFLSCMLLSMALQSSESPFKRTDSANPKSKVGKRTRTPEPSTPQPKPCTPTIDPTYLQLPENPSAPIKKAFLEQYAAVISAFLAATPDQLARNTFSVEYKQSTGAKVTLTMRRGKTHLTLNHQYSPEKTQNFIETAKLCDDLETMKVDDSQLYVSSR